ncbi:hypothetical protein SASPL_144746 [Salvia splendens]|uniref:Cellulose synthase A n=1 Tax=Salvia splendens TaxID=180675 RepID=A0A8X8Z728_SALSN|nr:hypothetical protein SASPL_144746 [Salvia splendens]
MARSLLVLRDFYGGLHSIDLHLQSDALPTTNWTDKMDMDWHFHGRALVHHLLDHHSICSVSSCLPYEDDLPRVDIFVSTADPQLEPPLMVPDTVLSVMAYDYPPEKLSVYLSDDGCSDLVFYALYEASKFSSAWLPFCKSFNVELRASKAYFSAVKQKLHSEMEAQVTDIMKLGRVPDHLRKHHKGLREWESGASRSNHHTILQGHDIAYVQYPQRFDNITKNDLYGSYLRVPNEVELLAFDTHGGPLCIGSCCFHIRDALTGKKYEKEFPINWKQVNEIQEPERENLLEETAKLANCGYEENSSWGHGGRKGFLGVAPVTLLSSLIQQTRWSEGLFQIFLSKYCPLIYGHGKIPIQLQLSYLCYNLWGANCLATLYYVTVPTFCLLKGVNLFPQFSSNWILPYAYVLVAKYTYSLGEFLTCGGTLKGWYNDQRMWLYKRVTSYLFGFCQIIMRYLGFAELNFVITGKNVDDDVSKRFEQEMMEFSAASSMFIILATIALFNLLTSISIARSIIIKKPATDLDACALQIL